MRCLTALLAAALACGAAMAHVQVLVANESPAAPQGAVREIDIRFIQHAMEDGPLHSMERPRTFGVLVNGKKHDLLDTLQEKTQDSKTLYSCSYTIQEPGAHVLYLEPSPYWDPDEELMMVHYTKVVFNSCGAGLKTESEMGWENWEGWDARVGFPVEIDPLIQCTSLWTGGVFRGFVHDEKGKPLANCRVEVEFYNKDKAVETPNPSFITQILKTDAQGVLAFTPVRAGWWGLTALPETNRKMKNPEGKAVSVEIGGVLWIRTTDMK